jgi:branched-chain amino acid transport system substrate-binding protein
MGQCLADLVQTAHLMVDIESTNPPISCFWQWWTLLTMPNGGDLQFRRRVNDPLTRRPNKIVLIYYYGGMKYQIKILPLVLTLFVSLLFAACGGGAEPGPSSPTSLNDADESTLPLDAADNFELAKNGVVRLEASTCTEDSIGTGFLINENQIVTVAHVVDGAQEIIAWIEEDVALAKIIAIDTERDLALLETDIPVGSHFFQLSDFEYRTGDEISIIGFPLGLEMSLTSGKISNDEIIFDSMPLVKFMQIDAPANPGNSGGPVLNASGEVIGIVDWQVSDAQGLNFAISTSSVDRIFESWMDNKPLPLTECSSSPSAAPATTAAPEPGPHLGDGSLGEVRVDAGEAIQIRSLNAISGNVAFLGIPNENGIRMAVEDYGQVKGFDVDLGTGMDDLCSADGGQAAASIIVANEDIVGVIGTSCSGAAAAASPLISEAGLVMISGSNTSPSLTSDLAGTAGANYKTGYYRTAHNDLYQGAAAADFALNVLGVTTAAAIHDGDPYTEGLAWAFAYAFEAGGGTITGFTAVNKGDTDMVPVLTEIASGAPDMLFFPIFQPEGDFIVQQVGDVSGMGGVVLMAADGLLNSNFLAVAETEGMYFSGPDVRYGSNANQSTGESATDVLADYNAEFGEAPAAPFWAHSYDATALLLDAIDSASYLDGDTLVIDRAGVRMHLNMISGYDGLIGNLSCDAYGDCSSSKITVIQNIDATNYWRSTSNVVFEYAPAH